MKKLIVLYIFYVLTIGCNTKTVEQKNTTSTINKGFVLTGNLQNFFSTKAYLNKIIDNVIYPIDSAKIENNTFTFKGIVEYPERFALTFNDYSSATVLILENKPIKIELDAHRINDPEIYGSELNSKLIEYKLTSKNIFKKIDNIFPQFQKARLENDVEKLNEIGNELKKIENEYTNFSYNFIEQNNNSYIAAMVLNDLLKSDKIDTTRVIESYKLLSNDVKKSPDAIQIATSLNLH